MMVDILIAGVSLLGVGTAAVLGVAFLLAAFRSAARDARRCELCEAEEILRRELPDLLERDRQHHRHHRHGRTREASRR